MKYLKILWIILLLSSCGTIKVDYDYEKETDFTAYNTYNYIADLQTGLSELDENRFFRAMDITLQAKGLKFSEEPDLLIDVNSMVYETQSGNTVGVGLGGGGGAIGGGVSIGIPVGSPKLTREIVLDFLDAKKDILVWQAIGKAPFREGEPPAVKEENLQEMVNKIFEKYPPKS
ncbi:DUF4136 domain-containing protein [Maribacter cobaltidurans]|uniref:Uncharacterized protein n=1 Tax=Maribacter cobaltidurans TaxID=1178778 RepID=A0A223V219_9FLAO|nr:DUF4136 domain-containing protein [Maribacter cobaltidurans]ASV29414.1 hypothetical protein CJ263_03770 [Maribacter cobaltidurans]GGD69313.1 hypothetical protein GCM10011412_03560 [Maribacter cobaltidurans]